MCREALQPLPLLSTLESSALPVFSARIQTRSQSPDHSVSSKHHFFPACCRTAGFIGSPKLSGLECGSELTLPRRPGSDLNDFRAGLPSLRREWMELRGQAALPKCQERALLSPD